MTESFIIDGMTLRPCGFASGETDGCLDESGEFEACEDCGLRAKCPMQGDEEE